MRMRLAYRTVKFGKTHRSGGESYRILASSARDSVFSVKEHEYEGAPE